MQRLSMMALAALALLADQPARAAEIRWDSYGIPHIYGPSVAAVVRGLGYAEMENHAETLLLNVAHARGRMAEYFGPGAGDANVDNDIRVRTEGIPSRAASWLSTGGAFQRSVIAAFVAGANAYAARHGDTIASSIRRVLPLVPSDITAAEQYGIDFNFIAEQDNISELIAAWRQGGDAAASALAHEITPTGSNGWAIGPRKSADGNAILMGNPHLPWGNNQPIPGLGLYQFMEANLVVGDPAKPSLNASGVVTVGSPYLGIGYNDDLGWTHTNDTIQAANLFEVTLAPDGTYAFGRRRLPLRHRTETIEIRQKDGSLAARTTDLYATVHGPVVARRGAQMLALRVAGLDQPGIVTQYWRMIEARNLDQFIAADAMLQMPFFNVVYADRDGHIMYVFGGRQPVRSGGDFAAYDGILDGSNAALLWTATLPWASLPHVIDPPGGFVANENDPPWTATFPQVAGSDPTRFPAYVAPHFMELRPQHAVRFLLSKPRFSVDDILAGKEQTHMLLADRVLPDLVQAARASKDPVAREAGEVLAHWDRTAEVASRGGPLFEAWWGLVIHDPAVTKDSTVNFYSPHPRFRVGWNAAHPLDTPTGLADPASCLPDLVRAATSLKKQYGSFDVAWGVVHRTVLVTHDGDFTRAIPVSQDPASGATGRFGTIRVVDSFARPDGAPGLLSWGGDSYVQLVEFAREGAKARSLLGYGNASRPGSSHITDQLAIFDAKTLRPAWRTRAEVVAHTVRIETD